MSSSNAHVKWAQRKDKLFITVEVTDAKDVTVDFTDKTVVVAGTGIYTVGGAPGPFKATLSLSDDIDSSKSTFKTHGFCVQVCAIKADAGKEHWGRLTAEPVKALKNWLSVDWTLWKDEEDEIAGEKVDFGGYGGGMGGGMGGMGGGGGMGGMDLASMMGGMGGMGGGGGMGGMDMAAMMQQMGGMGGMGGGMGGGDDEEGGAGDSDDEEAPPNLEDVDGKSSQKA